MCKPHPAQEDPEDKSVGNQESSDGKYYTLASFILFLSHPLMAAVRDRLARPPSSFRTVILLMVMTIVSDLWSGRYSGKNS